MIKKMDFVENLDDGKVAPQELMKKGGAWLGEARNWIKWNCFRGDDVTWGSQELLNFKGITVSEFEALASRIAAEAINEYESKRKSDEAFVKVVAKTE